jgi:hypothetical protein
VRTYFHAKWSIPISLVSIFSVLMPPHPILSSRASIPSWPTLVETSIYIKAAFLLSLVIIALREIVILIVQRKSGTLNTIMDREDTLADQEKGIANRQRNDSPHGEALLSSTNSGKDSEVSQEKVSDPQQQKDDVPSRQSSEEEQNHYLQSLKEETLNPALIPIYPWIAPPRSLPGPYDAPYYPVPLPTLRRHTDEAPATKSEESPSIKTEEESNTPPEELEMISYTRHATPNHPTTLETFITISPNRWRRTQRTTSVSAG